VLLELFAYNGLVNCLGGVGGKLHPIQHAPPSFIPEQSSGKGEGVGGDEGMEAGLGLEIHFNVDLSESRKSTKGGGSILMSIDVDKRHDDG
jgi:hypothetical protein